jgi:tetratricopeptide (TPR) repeat protein
MRSLLLIFGIILGLLISQVTFAGDSNEAVWRALLKQSQQLSQKREFGQAEEMAQQAIEFARQSFGDEDPKLARSLRRLAYIYSAQKRFSESAPLLQQGLGIIEGHYGPKHKRVASYLSSLAYQHSRLGDNPKAKALHERALAMREELLGTEHIDLAYNLNSLAVIAQSDGDLDRAGSLYWRCLRIREKNLPADHNQIAQSWRYIAQLYKRQLRYSDAVLAQREAVAVKQAKYGAGHKRVVRYEQDLTRLENLAAANGIQIADSIQGAPVQQQSTTLAKKGDKHGQRQVPPPNTVKIQKPELIKNAPPLVNELASELEMLINQGLSYAGSILSRNFTHFLPAIILILVLLRIVKSLVRRLNRHSERGSMEQQDDHDTGSPPGSMVQRNDRDIVQPVQDMNPQRRRNTFG